MSANLDELEAVNILLSVIGEAPVDSLVLPGPVEAARAKRVLHEISRAVQSKGWNFNTERDYYIPAEASGRVIVPKNTLAADATDIETKVTLRGNSLYDQTRHTYDFSEQGGLTCDLTLYLPFEELPTAARYYITVRAARTFQARELGSDVLDRFSAEDEAKALADFLHSDMQAGDYNVFQNPIIARLSRN